MFLLTADVLHRHIPILLNSNNTSEQAPSLHFTVRVASTTRQPSPRDPHSHYTNCQVIHKQYAPNSKQIHEFVWNTFHNFHLSSPFVKKSWWQQCSSPDVALSLSLEPRCMSFSSQLVPIHLEIQPIARLEHLTITPSTNTHLQEVRNVHSNWSTYHSSLTLISFTQPIGLHLDKESKVWKLVLPGVWRHADW